ncbi:MAG TPA: hypothetical protein VN952_09610, partial [Chthoniobacterales bacterium]|nr:hypothetical protein [Chthoniobacterales bacterium]
FEPSSTATSSQSGSVWHLMLSSTAGSVPAALRTGMTIETFGGSVINGMKATPTAPAMTVRVKDNLL